MKNFKIIFLSLILLLGLSACQVPFTDKQVTIPFIEKNPDDVISLMQEVIFNNINSYKQEGFSEVLLDFPEQEEIEKAINDMKEGEDELLISSNFNSAMLATEMIKIPDIKVTNEYFASMLKNKDNTVDQEMSSKMSIDLGNMIYSGEISQKQVDSKNYFMVKSLPSIVEMFISSDVMNKWIVFEGMEDGMNLENFSPIPGFSIESIGEGLEGNKEEIKESIKNRLDSFQTSIQEINIFIPRERLADESIDNNNCYHYVVSLNPEIINKMKVLVSGISEDMETDEEERKVLDKLLDNFSSAILDNGGELWIDKEDFYLRKIVFDIKLNAMKLLEDVSEEKIPDLDIIIEINIESRMFDFNQVESIDVPSEAISINELMKDVFPQGGIMNEADYGDSMDNEIESVDSDGDGLDDFSETIFGTDPNNADTDGDGYSDGDEVENGYNPAGPGTIDEFWQKEMGEDMISL